MGRADQRRGSSGAGWGDGAEGCEITSMRVSRWDAAGTAYRAADYGKAGMASESFADGIRSGDLRGRAGWAERGGLWRFGGIEDRADRAIGRLPAARHYRADPELT